MDGKKYLGIYLSKNGATVVCLDSQGRERNISGCFSVCLDQDQQQQGPQELVRLIAEGSAEKIPMYRDCEAAVALDCAMFMQHHVRSEFKDPSQVAATVRFDTEEALSTDISDVAIAFRINSTNQTGSELTVFTAQREILSDILVSLQSHGIDPITIEPDVNCLSRFVLQNVPLPEGSPCLLSMLSARSCYFICVVQSQEAPAVRTFLVDPRQNRTELLAREVPVTAAIVGAGQTMNCLKVFDSTGSVNHHQLAERLGIDTSDIDLARAAGDDTLAECEDPVGFAIAYGAALAHSEKAQSINFRNDFMPYQGKKMRLQKTLKFLSISLCTFILAVGLYFQLQLLQKNKYCRQLRAKFEKQYSAVMPGSRKPPASIKKAVGKLRSEVKRIEVGRGLSTGTGKESISSKLILVLTAINECAAKTNLNIDSVTITDRNIRVAGDTGSLGYKNTLRFFQAIKDVGLVISQEKVDTKANRDNFRVTITSGK